MGLIKTDNLMKEVIDSVSQDKSGRVTSIDDKSINPAHGYSPLEIAIPWLPVNSTTHFYSHGQWSHHDLLEHILLFTGPAAVKVAVWTMSITAANKLALLLNKGLITSLDMILDARCKTRIPEAHQLASKAFDRLVITPCHAKVTVIKNESNNVAISTSANYTNNPRLEVGILSTIPEVARFYDDILTQILEKNTWT